MSFFVLVTSSAFFDYLVPIVSVPCFLSCFAFNLLIVSRVLSEGVRSLFSPLPAPACPPGAVAFAGFAAGVGGEASESVVEFVLLDELDLFGGAESLLASFFLTSTSYYFLGSGGAGASSFFLQVVILHQNHASISSMMNIY